MTVKRAKEVRTTEDHICPDSVSGICALIRSILESSGKVESFHFEVGQPVRVIRWIERNDLMEYEEESLDALIQGRELVEYLPAEEASSFQVIFQLMQRLRNERLYPVCWATGVEEENVLDTWFGLVPSPGGVSSLREVCGLPVERLKSIPEETLILCGASFPRATHQDIVFSVKTTIDLRRKTHAEQDRRDADQGGDHSPEHRAPARALAGPRGGHSGEGGNRSGLTGARLLGSPKVRRPAPGADGEG